MRLPLELPVLLAAPAAFEHVEPLMVYVERHPKHYPAEYAHVAHPVPHAIIADPER